jgi:hypothetical protein
MHALIQASRGIYTNSFGSGLPLTLFCRFCVYIIMGILKLTKINSEREILCNQSTSVQQLASTWVLENKPHFMTSDRRAI